MSGGGAPANTTSTTTINQSPWQNATYRALALGTPENLGPVAQQLKIGQQLTNDWMDIQSGRNPGLYYGMPNASPEQVAMAKAGQDIGFAGGRAPAVSGETKPMAVEEQPTETQAAAKGGIMSLRGFADGGLTKEEEAWIKTKQKEVEKGRKLTGANKTRMENLTAKQKSSQDRAASSRPFSYSDIATPTAFLDPTTGQNMLPDAQLAFQQARNLGLPPQLAQATDAYNQAIAGLQGMTNYTPQQVEAAKIARGDIRDVNAQQAQVERMQGGPNVKAVKARAEQMTGPASWTEQGTAAQYMSPYMQNVVDIQKREASRDFAKQMAKLDAQAAQAGAYGGSRQAIERSEARRNQAQRLGDIQAQGLQQAYGQGMGQFQAESQLGQGAKQSNLSAAMQAILANQQAGMTAQQLNQLYGQGGFQAQAANMAAQNLANNNYVQQMLTAQGMNQGMDWNTASQNAQMQMQAALANQQAGLQANQQNLGAYGAIGNMAQGLGGLGATQSQIGLNNLAALGQSATAQTQYAQGALDRRTQNAINYYNLPAQFNAPGINAINAQPVAGGTNTSSQRYNQANPFGSYAKGGTVKWGPKK